MKHLDLGNAERSIHAKRVEEEFGLRSVVFSTHQNHIIIPPGTVNDDLNAGQSIYSVHETHNIRKKPSFAEQNLKLSMTQHQKFNSSLPSFPNSARNNYTSNRKDRNNTVGESTDFESVGLSIN